SGGIEEESNLVYACSACNKAKGDCWSPPNAETRLLHSQRDALHEHMRLSPDDHLQPLTPTGAFHIRRLRLNRPQRVALRQVRRRATRNIVRLSELEKQIVELRREIVSLEGQSVRKRPEIGREGRSIAQYNSPHHRGEGDTPCVSKHALRIEALYKVE